jgi:hypothetical protein
MKYKLPFSLTQLHYIVIMSSPFFSTFTKYEQKNILSHINSYDVMKICMKKYYLEPSDLDTIYKVLKKAGEMSAANEAKLQASTSSQPMEIPVVNINVPDYPDRGASTSRGPLKTALGQASYAKQGLAAPNTDISCSGPNLLLPSTAIYDKKINIQKILKFFLLPLLNLYLPTYFLLFFSTFSLS